MTISEDVEQIGRGLAGAADVSLSSTLNEALGRFIGDAYKAAAGYIIDQDGRQSDRFAAVVSIASVSGPTDPCAIPADKTAAVIDVCDELTSTNSVLRMRASRTQRRLKRPRFRKKKQEQTSPSGLVLAARSTVPLEVVAEELDRLNSKTPSSQWPDMIAVASTGVINYAVQFPGEAISGGFLPRPKAPSPITCHLST